MDDLTISAVILMEGGTDFDLQILDPNYTPETQKPKAPEEKTTPKKWVIYIAG